MYGFHPGGIFVLKDFCVRWWAPVRPESAISMARNADNLKDVSKGCKYARSHSNGVPKYAQGWKPCSATKTETMAPPSTDGRPSLRMGALG